MDSLDPILTGIADLIKNGLGPTEAANQAANEWMNITRLGNNICELQSRRVALMYAFYREESVRRHFEKSDPVFVKDLQNILSLFVPIHYSNFFQGPHAFVVSVSVVYSMWHANDLGAVRCVEPETPRTE